MMAKKGNGLSPMDYAMSYLTARDRTEREIQAYLDSKEFGEADIEATVSRLKELGLIDDRRYAEQFVRTRLATKPVSKAHLYRQLLEHQISKNYIAEALEAVDSDSELENAIAVAHKFYRQFSNLDPQIRKQRVLSRLQARGYGYDISSRAYQTVETETEEQA